MSVEHISLTIRKTIGDAPIALNNDFFVEAGTKYYLDSQVDDWFLREFTNVDDVDALISMFDDADATEYMNISQFNSKLLTDKKFYDEVVGFLAGQFKKNCAEKQLIVEENNSVGKFKSFRVIWYDDFYNEDWVDNIIYLNDVLTCFDIKGN